MSATGEKLWDVLNHERREEPLGPGIFTLYATNNWSASLVPKSEPTVPVGQRIAMKAFYSNEQKDVCEKEFKLLSSCSHRNIVTVFELQLTAADTHAKQYAPFYLMEHADCSLNNLIMDNSTYLTDMDGTANGSYTLTRCLTYLKQIADAVDYLHYRIKVPIMHRDLKSHNILLFDAGRVCKLCDFDHSRAMEGNEATITPNKGTYQWTAPEVLSNSDDRIEYTLAADSYSFGMVICELLFRDAPQNIGQDFDHASNPEELDPSYAVRYVNSSKQCKCLYLDLPKAQFCFEANMRQLLLIQEMLQKLLILLPEKRLNFKEINRMLSSLKSSDLPPLSIGGNESPTSSNSQQSGRTPVSINYSLKRDGRSSFTKQEIARIEEVQKCMIPNAQTWASKDKQIAINAKHTISVELGANAVPYLQHKILADESDGQVLLDYCRADEDRQHTKRLADFFKDEPLVGLRNLTIEVDRNEAYRPDRDV